MNVFAKFVAAAFGAAIAFSAVSAEAATLYISEYANGVTSIGSQQAQVPPEPAITNQTVALSGTSAQSASFNSKTRYIRLICDEGCSILVGTNPTATTSSFLLQQGQQVSIGVSPGEIIAAIANAAGNTATGGGGTVAIDQTTPGSTNGVDIVPLPAANDPFTKVTVNITSATTTHVVAGTAAQTIRVYKVVLNFGTAQTLNVAGTGGTSLVGAAMTMNAGSGLVLDFSGTPWWTTVAGEGLDFVTTTTGAVTGTLYYVKN